LVIEPIEPTSLDTFAIREAGATVSNGSIALVTPTTPKTFVSKTVRIELSVVSLGRPCGPLEFKCQVLHVPDADQRLIVYCAAPGSATQLAFRQLAGVTAAG
jgi:hypothetical protein